MNIFAVHEDPRMAALELPDKLVPKMIVESAQMLSTAHRVLDGDEKADMLHLYKKAYENHPSTIWVRQDNNHTSYTVDSYQQFVTQDKPYMQDVFKAYTRAIQKKELHKDSHIDMSGMDYPPPWVTRYATTEQKKHIDLHKLMNPETAI